jgi:hypothetical protein
LQDKPCAFVAVFVLIAVAMSHTMYAMLMTVKAAYHHDDVAAISIVTVAFVCFTLITAFCGASALLVAAHGKDDEQPEQPEQMPEKEPPNEDKDAQQGHA